MCVECSTDPCSADITSLLPSAGPVYSVSPRRRSTAADARRRSTTLAPTLSIRTAPPSSPRIPPQSYCPSSSTSSPSSSSVASLVSCNRSRPPRSRSGPPPACAAHLRSTPSQRTSSGSERPPPPCERTTRARSPSLRSSRGRRRSSCTRTLRRWSRTAITT